MASKGQKIFIWVIAITMLVGSIGASFLVIIANDNNTKELKNQQAQFDKMQKQQEELAKRMKQPSKPLPGYKVEKFDAKGIAKLKIEDLKQGSGDKTVTADSTLKVNYVGWVADGTIFDSTFRKGDKAPVAVEFPLSGTIEGWVKGLEGAKIGSVRKLTIPANLAYGSQKKEKIPANSPLMFIVEIVDIKNS